LIGFASFNPSTLNLSTFRRGSGQMNSRASPPHQIKPASTIGRAAAHWSRRVAKRL
jgi:hypothetical protein